MDAYREGAEVEINPEEGVVRIGDQTFNFPKLPPEIIAIRDAGGLLERVRAKLKERGSVDGKS